MSDSESQSGSGSDSVSDVEMPVVKPKASKKRKRTSKRTEKMKARDDEEEEEEPAVSHTRKKQKASATAAVPTAMDEDKDDTGAIEVSASTPVDKGSKVAEVAVFVPCGPGADSDAHTGFIQSMKQAYAHNPEGAYFCPKRLLTAPGVKCQGVKTSVVMFEIYSKAFRSCMLYSELFYQRRSILFADHNYADFRWGSTWCKFAPRSSPGDMHPTHPSISRSGMAFIQSVFNRILKALIIVAQSKDLQSGECMAKAGFRDDDTEHTRLSVMWRNLKSPFTLVKKETLLPGLVVNKNDINKSYIEFKFDDMSDCAFTYNAQHWRKRNDKAGPSNEPAAFGELLATTLKAHAEGIETFYNDEDIDAMRIIEENSTGQFSRFDYVAPKTQVWNSAKKTHQYDTLAALRMGRPGKGSRAYIDMKLAKISVSSGKVIPHFNANPTFMWGFEPVMGASHGGGSGSSMIGSAPPLMLPHMRQDDADAFGGQSHTLTFGGSG